MWSHLRRITIAFLAISMVGACSSKKDENKNNPQKQEEPEVQNKAAISEDDNILASAGKDQQIKIWSLANGDQLHNLQKHQGKIWCLAMTPDGKNAQFWLERLILVGLKAVDGKKAQIWLD